nr:immunoglobulin heavy chain junction region [Macaca mulatta]
CATRIAAGVGNFDYW